MKYLYLISILILLISCETSNQIFPVEKNRIGLYTNVGSTEYLSNQGSSITSHYYINPGIKYGLTDHLNIGIDTTFILGFEETQSVFNSVNTYILAAYNYRKHNITSQFSIIIPNLNNFEKEEITILHFFDCAFSYYYDGGIIKPYFNYPLRKLPSIGIALDFKKILFNYSFTFFQIQILKLDTVFINNFGICLIL